MDDIKSYDSFQADRVGGNKTTQTNIKYHILNKMGHVTLGQEDHRQDLQSLKEILRETCQIFQHQP